MGFKLTGGSGGASSLPDYTKITLYPRKWINGNDVWEVTYFDKLPPYQSEDIPIGFASFIFDMIVPIEYSFSRLSKSLHQWVMHDGWYIYKHQYSNLVCLRISNNTAEPIWVSGVLKYTIHNT